MADYTTLVGAKSVQGSIQNWVNRSDIPAVEILSEAQAEIYETLRVREMQSRTVLTFAMGSQTTALPANFLEPLGYTPYGWGGDIPFVHENTLNEVRDTTGLLSTGTPSRWTVVGTTAYVDVFPDSSFSGVLLYYAQPDPLSLTNPTNFLTSRYPALLRYACLAKAHEHMKSDLATGYLQLAMQKIASANASNEMWRMGQYIPGG